MNNLIPKNPFLLAGAEEKYSEKVSTILKNNGFNNIRFVNKPEKIIDILNLMPVSCIILIASSEETLKNITLVKEKYPESQIVLILEDKMEISELYYKNIYFVIKKSKIKQELIFALKKILEVQKLYLENLSIKKAFLEEQDKLDFSSFEKIKTRNEKMISIFKYLKAISNSKDVILIVGEIGTGKSYFAESIHKESLNTGKFIIINPNEIEEQNLQRHFFGEVLIDGKLIKGLAQEAENGTIYIRGIDKINLKTQNILYNFIVDREYYPVNSAKPYYTNAKIIVGAREDLTVKNKKKEMLDGLYYKLKTFQVNIPPLRDRLRDDLVLLVNYFIDNKSEEMRKPKPVLDERIFNLLFSYTYPGNVDELYSMLTNALTNNGNTNNFLKALKDFINNSNGELINKNIEQKKHKIYIKDSKLPTLEEANRELINIALERSGNRIPVAANFLGVTKNKLQELILKYQIKIKAF